MRRPIINTLLARLHFLTLSMRPLWCLQSPFTHTQHHPKTIPETCSQRQPELNTWCLSNGQTINKRRLDTDSFNGRWTKSCTTFAYAVILCCQPMAPLWPQIQCCSRMGGAGFCPPEAFLSTPQPELNIKLGARGCKLKWCRILSTDCFYKVKFPHMESRW